MAVSTQVMFLKTTGFSPFLAFIFFSTLSSYNLHWYLTHHCHYPSQRLGWSEIHRKFHIVVFILASCGSAFLAFFLLDHFIWIGLAGALTFLYTAPKFPHPFFKFLRKIAIGKTIFLSLVWTYVTAVLPIQIENQNWTTEMTLNGMGRFFFIYAICILFDLRDREDDKKDGIRSLITFLDERGIKRLFHFSLATSVAFSLLHLFYEYNLAATLVEILPTLGLFLIYPKALNTNSDYFYYFFLDGWMILPAVMILCLLH